MLRSTSTRPHRLSYLFKHLYRRSSLLRRITSTNDYSTCTTTTDISKSSSNAKNANQDIDSTLTSKDILFLSPTLWPQPDASAAGVRTSSLLQHFSSASTSTSASHNQFNNVHFGCGLKEQPNPNIGISFPRVQLHHLPPNRLDRIQKFVKENVKGELKAVVFDRFFAEEAYSFQFHKHGETANVLRILDMQDMHSLRYHRQNLIREIDSSSEKRSGIEFGLGLDHFKDDTFMNSFPMVAQGTLMSSSQSQSRQSYGKDKNAHLTLLRELASIHRSDLTLVCSQFELDLLTDEYGINPDKLVLAPFFTKEVDYSYCDSNEHEMQTEIETETLLSQSYERRKDFIALGGFKHLPNVDQVLMLKHHLWPQIRKQIPDAKLHIYGSYPPQRIQQLHDVKNGFIVHGYVDDLDLPLGGSRVLLAPLRYGAGVKGKIVDAWRFGCPVVTTPIGSEGIGNTNRNGDGNGNGNGIDKDHHDTTLTKDWGGIVAYNNDDFIKGAIELYSNKDEWIRAQLNSRRLSKELFDATSNLAVVDDAIALAMETMHSRRQRDYTSAMLWQDSARSTEYFSRWIELKESLSS